MSYSADNFLLDTVNSVIEETATLVTKDYVMQKLSTTGSVTLQEAENVFAITKTICENGAEDLIPDNIDIPEEDLGNDVGLDDGGDLDISELEGIILPDSEGNEYTIQGGIIVPYNSGEDDAITGTDDTGNDVDPTIGESTTVVADPTANPAELTENSGATVNPEDTGVISNTDNSKDSTITENTGYTTSSDLISQIVSNINAFK